MPELTEKFSPVVVCVMDMLERYPVSRSRDVYKLLYQAFHGAEHAIDDESSVRRWLETELEEVDSIDPDESHPLIEPVNIPGATPVLYRLHLGPAKASGVSIDTILQEFLRVGREFSKQSDAFREAWLEVGRAIVEGYLPLSQEEYLQFSDEMKNAGWPPAHHSEAYRDAYDPHYRLVLHAELLP